MKETEKPVYRLVIDGGAIAYVDSMGIEALQNAFTDGKGVNVNVLYADFSGKSNLYF
jgi:anti-anti-sigma regulatory factor